MSGGCLVELGPLCRLLLLLAGLGLPERVGFLIGYTSARGASRVAAYYAVENAAAEPGAFESNPLDVVAAHRAAWSLGVDVVGVFHTHPTGPPKPSSRDIENMRLWPIIWVIASPLGIAAYKPRDREAGLEECAVRCL
ncbi:MAG: M67 family metallopeptidase [Desulfurococcales archaeon]|nr:M67 family metallopeptidase [Desulfurococcales archaeon]